MLSLVHRGAHITLRTTDLARTITHTVQSLWRNGTNKRSHLWEGFLIGILFSLAIITTVCGISLSSKVRHRYKKNVLKGESDYC